MIEYRLFTDMTADISEELLSRCGEISFLPMPVRIGEVEYMYGLDSDMSVQHFYDMQRNGCFATTAQITPAVFMEAFEPWLKQGVDILYLCFSSGLSGCWASAQMAARELREAYPGRRIICIDTLGASIGEGLLIYEASRKQAEGISIEALAEWVEAYRLKVCHWFVVDGFTHLKHGGRVSTAVAAIGSILTIKPLLHVDEEGKLAVMGKPRGMKAAIKAQLTHFAEGWEPDLGRQIMIGHGDCLELAEMLGEQLKAAHPQAEISYAMIGPVIGAHTGPGMLALTYWGSNR